MKKINLNTFEQLLACDNLKSLRGDLIKIKAKFENSSPGSVVSITLNGKAENISSEYLINEIDQIINTYTLERSRYYLKRLIKSIKEEKKGKINDLNLNRWKEYDDIFTDSLWVLKKRDRSGEHKASYWGNFVPQIPNQLLRRYTKKGELVLDPFLGSGTTLIECKRLGRNGIGIELLENIALSTRKIIEKEKADKKEIISEIINADSSELDYKKELKRIGAKSIQFLIMHPPYWDIIKFSRKKMIFRMPKQ